MHRVRRSLTLPVLFAAFLTLSGAGRGQRVLDAREPAVAPGADSALRKRRDSRCPS